MKITRDVANAIAALDPPVLAIVEEMIRRKLAGDREVSVIIPMRTQDKNCIRPTFRSGKIIGSRSEHVISIDEDVFFAELKEEKRNWKLKSHQREWSESQKMTVIDPLAWMALRPYTPDERISLLYALMPGAGFGFPIGNVRIGRHEQSWKDREKYGNLNQIVARCVTEAYEWRENVLTLKAGVPMTVAKGLEKNPVPLEKIVEMGEGFEATAKRYFASKHKEKTCLKVTIEPIAKSVHDDPPYL